MTLTFLYIASAVLTYEVWCWSDLWLGYPWRQVYRLRKRWRSRQVREGRSSQDWSWSRSERTEAFLERTEAFRFRWNKVSVCILDNLYINLTLPKSCVFHSSCFIIGPNTSKFGMQTRLEVSHAFRKCLIKQDWKSFQSLPASIILVYCIRSNMG
jgi:hypothetical protein